MPAELGWILAGLGWAFAFVLVLLIRDMRGRFHVWARQTSSQLEEAAKIISKIYRIHLTCPWCDWEHDVVREDRDEGIEAGNELIALHNIEADHPVQLGVIPRTGYYKGERLN